MEKTKKFLNVKEVASLIGVHIQTLYRWRKERKHLPFFIIENNVRYPKDDVEKFINERMIKPIN